MSAVLIEGLGKAFGAVTVLDGVDLRIPTGSLTVILGPSGCGKTTLLRLIAGFDRPDRGTIAIDGQMVCDARTYRPPERRRIGYVAQEGALFPHLSVAENIGFGLKGGASRNRARIAELLALVGLDPDLAKRQPHQVSGGQQQRVALARALAPEPRVVLLDEPFSALDAGLREGTRIAVAEALTAAGTTAVLVTHDQGEALSLGTQVAVMRGGRLAQVGPPATLYSDPVDREMATFLGDAVLLPATVRGGRASCALGLFALRTPIADGPAEVMLRPEQIAVAPAGSSGVAAELLGCTYYGKDAALRLRLVDADAIITARIPGHALPTAGEVVAVSVNGPVVAYPR
ncbi:MAG: ABC transporter ATP-binding protein [Thermomicrobiales bacterium]